MVGSKNQFGGGESGVSDSRFELGQVLGRGGNGIVCAAVDRQTGRHVALKVLPEGVMNRVTLARLAREARTASMINHPNVCATLDRGLLDDGRPFVSMELLEGQTLRQYMMEKEARGERLTAEEAIEIAVQMLAGLDAAHALGVVHRDIKPENVFIVWRAGSHRPLVKLMDFGICRRADHALDMQTLTVAGSVVGTPGYLAPEQVYGDRTIDPRADLFAVGLVVFEMLTGRAAVQGNNPLELAAAATARVPSVRQFASEIPTLLDRIVAHATEQEPELRYPSAALFQHDLLEARTSIRRSGRRTISAVAPVVKVVAEISKSYDERLATETSEGYWNATTRRMKAKEAPRRRVA